MVVEIVIIPDRLLGDRTVKRLLEAFQGIDGIYNIIIQGPTYMPRKIRLGDQTIETSVKVGKIYMQIEDESVIEKVDGICKDTFSFGYSIHVGQFTKTRPTVSDYLGKTPFKDLGTLKRK
ncbi:MAG: methyl-coenzyme M reductase operon protein D [Candidatus Syntropharchaeia archaeon]